MEIWIALTLLTCVWFVPVAHIALSDNVSTTSTRYLLVGSLMAITFISVLKII